jgi:hypothetical protein
MTATRSVKIVAIARNDGFNVLRFEAREIGPTGSSGEEPKAGHYSF